MQNPDPQASDPFERAEAHLESTSATRKAAASKDALGYTASGQSALNIPMIIALVLAILLAVSVLIGARITFNKASDQPVGLTLLDTPEASSAECSQFIDALPDKLNGYTRAEIAEPAPPGAAAWKKDSVDRIVVRCGVNMPLQFSPLSSTEDFDGTTWLKVVDTTPDSTMQTWYSVSRQPAVAITADASAVTEQDFPAKELAGALDKLESIAPAPYDLPLAHIEASGSKRCDALIDALPASFGSQPEYARYSDDALSGHKAMVAWVAPGYEPIVLRCGVPFPAEYAPGAQLNQVDNIPWFEDTTLGNGTTASTWYALGREEIVAVSIPQSAGNAGLVALGRAIDATLAEEPLPKN